MTSVAVVAHEGKTLDGGLTRLRQLLCEKGFSDPIWYEVPKSRKAPECARLAIEQGADLLFLWGGDGTIQRCLEAVAGSGVVVAILPAGTANLLANNLKIPIDLAAAVELGFSGERRRIDVGVLNGERFAVMAGAGFDARMMKAADGGLKDHFGRLAYVFTGVRATRSASRKAKVRIDGSVWFNGPASCVLFGNMGTLTGGLTAFVEARPDDGLIEVAVVTVVGVPQWARVLARVAVKQVDRSPLVRTSRGRQLEVKFDRPTAYELDGGARSSKRRLHVEVEPGALLVCVPDDQSP